MIRRTPLIGVWLLLLAACQGGGRGEPVAASSPFAPAALGDVRIERHVVGMGRANCYLVWAHGRPDAFVVDPGAEADRIARAARRHGLEIRAIVHTHGHGDHVGGSRALQAASGAPIHRHPLQGEVRMPSLHPAGQAGAVLDLRDGDTLRVGGLTFEVIHTPGHSPGSVCLSGHGVLFTGDLLFRGSVGRTDFSGGSDAELRRSIHERLARVPDGARVLPGHGEETTMGHERRTNPWLKR